MPTYCLVLLTSANLSSLLSAHARTHAITHTHNNRERSSFAGGKDARRCLRVNGVVEDSGEGVVDVVDHVIQLVLGL